MIGAPNYTPPPSPVFRVGLGATKSAFVQGFDREAQQVPAFSYIGGTKKCTVLPRGPMLVTLDNTHGDADAVLMVGNYDTVSAIGMTYLGYWGNVPAQPVWTVPQGQKASRVFTFPKDYLLAFVTGPFGTLPFTLQPLGLIDRACSSMPVMPDPPFLRNTPP